MKKRGLLVFILLLVFISACTTQKTTENPPSVDLKSNVVILKNFAFEPAELTIKSGETVTWIQQDNTIHTVVSAGLFESSALNGGDKFTFTFTKIGSYPYHCGIHPSMKGTINVQ